MSRIVIADLPEIQDLNETELQEIYGAGRPVRRKSRESFPGIVHLEVLERREVFSATGLQAVASASTAEGVAAEMQGSKVEKDTAGNTVFTQSEKGSVIARSVFSPTGEIMSYERTVGDIRVSASYQNGKLTSITSSKAGVPIIRQDFSLDGSVTKETRYDVSGKRVFEISWKDGLQQETEYVAGATARVRTYKMNTKLKKNVMIYEETWSSGKKIGQTARTDSDELKSQWQTNGDQRFAVTIENGIRHERTFLRGVEQLHEAYPNLSDLSAAHMKPLLRETRTDSGTLIQRETWSYDATGTRHSIESHKGSQKVVENRINEIHVDRTVSDKQGITEFETWNTAGQQLTRKVYGSNWTESYEYTTETTGSGKSKVTKTFVSMSSYRKNGALERREWFDANGITKRYYYTTEKGQLRTTTKETFDGNSHTISDHTVAGTESKSIYVKGKLVQNIVYIGGERVEQTDFHSNGKVEAYWYRIDSHSEVRTIYNEKGQKTEQRISRDGKAESHRWYDAATGRDVRFRVFDAKGHKIHQVDWEYRSNGDVIKRARDYQEKGTQEIQRREWINDSASYYVLLDWSVKRTTWTAIVERHYDDGRLVSDVERAPDGTLVKDHRWTWVRTSVPTISGGKLTTKVRWTAIPVSAFGETLWNCHDVGGEMSLWNPQSGDFSVSRDDYDNAKRDGGAVFAPLGDGYETYIRGPIEEKNREAREEYNRIRDRVLPSILEQRNRIWNDVILPAFPILKQANNALKAIGKATPNGFTWKDIEERAGIAGKNAISAGKKVAEEIGRVPENTAAARDKIIGDGKREVDAAKKDIDKAQKEVASAHETLKTKADKVISTGDKVWEETKKAAKPIVDIVTAVFTTDLVKIEVDSVGKLSFNFATGGYYGDLDLIAGWKFNTEQFKALMTNEFQLPQVDPLTAATSLSGLRSSVTTNYDEVRQAQYEDHVGGNVYFASKRFAEWAGPGTVARAVAAALAGDGGQILAEAKSYLSLELEDLSIWLQQRGAKDAPKLAVQILRAIVDQSSLVLPELSVEFTSVNFTNHLSAGGAVGAATDAIGIDASASATLSHMAFAIVWGGVPESDPLLDSINKFQSMKLQGGMDDFNALALEELDKLDLPGSDFLKEILLTGHVGVDSDNALDKTVMNKFSEMFGIDNSASLAEYLHTEYENKKGNPVINLSQYGNLKDTLNSRLSELAIGNEGSAEVTTLQFNLNTMSFEVEFVVHHKYASGSLADIGKDLVGMAS